MKRIILLLSVVFIGCNRSGDTNFDRMIDSTNLIIKQADSINKQNGRYLDNLIIEQKKFLYYNNKCDSFDNLITYYENKFNFHLEYKSDSIYFDHRQCKRFIDSSIRYYKLMNPKWELTDNKKGK